MSLLNSIPRIRSSTYICNGCKAKRTINIDEEIHFNRRDLQNKGLASYIDIHQDQHDLNRADHGVKLFVDANFAVRTNDLIKINSSNSLGLNLPSPKVTQTEVVITEEFNSWLEISFESSTHNMKIKYQNSLEYLQAKKTKTLEIESPFNTTTLVVQFLPDEVGEESLIYLIKWMKELAKWIELTPKMQSSFLLALFKIIDINYIRPPTITDELIISVLLDMYASIRLIESPNEEILLFKGKGGLFEDFEVFKTTIGIDFSTLRIITEMLREQNNVTINELYEAVINKNDNKEAAETLAQVIIDLIRLDSIDYKVSYLQ